MVCYAANPNSQLWRAFRTMFEATADPMVRDREALVDVPGVQAAFVFGSTAKAEDSREGDIDVFVLEDVSTDRQKLFGQLAEVGMLIGREVNAIRYASSNLPSDSGAPSTPRRSSSGMCLKAQSNGWQVSLKCWRLSRRRRA